MTEAGGRGGGLEKAITGEDTGRAPEDPRGRGGRGGRWLLLEWW